MSRLSVIAFAGLGLALASGGRARAQAPAADALDAPANASAVELQQYLQEEPSQSAAGSRDQQFRFHRRSSWAKIRAANRLLQIGRKDSQLTAALRAKRHYLGVLGQLGERKYRDQSARYYREMSADDNPAIAAAAQRLETYEKLNDWRGLDPSGKQLVVQQAQSLLEQEPHSLENVRLASNVANVAGSAGDEPLAIELLDYMIPSLKDTPNQAIQELAPKVEGLSRRLRLLGNEMQLEGTTLAGEPLDWQAYRGKVVLVDFWATWCGPCLAELPNMRRCYQQHHAKGFEVIGVSLDESPQAVGQFVQQQGMPWTVLCGRTSADSGWNHPMAVRYGIRRLPQAILVDREGRVVSMNASGEELAALLDELLSAPAAE